MQYLIKLVLIAFSALIFLQTAYADIGDEVAIEDHLENGEEFSISLKRLIRHGEELFTAVWTRQEGGGRPFTTGTGKELVDTTKPLVFPRANNRVSAPDADACAGCHNQPFGVAGGGGDFVTSVFVLGQRFDFATFDRLDFAPLRGSVDENMNPVTLQSIANSRATLGMFGSGFIEMLSRQMTSDLQALRDTLGTGASVDLETKGVSFGSLSRNRGGDWDTSAVEGLGPASLVSVGAANPPSLLIRPFHQAGAVVSIREFTNNAFNHHHGMQAEERFGNGIDQDGDGFVNELTIADITASAIHQATLAVPGRVIPNNHEVEQAVLKGEEKFEDIGCNQCHRSLPLDNRGWIYSEPNPFNPPGNLQLNDGPSLKVNLLRHKLPNPRLKAKHGVVMVPAYTDLKLHDITTGPDDPNREVLNQAHPAGSAEFLAGNSHFLTKKLWGAANEPPFFHHGQFKTLREAIENHAGEAITARMGYDALSEYEQDSIIEFLKSLQVLPPGTKHLVIDERGKSKKWPPKRRHH